MPKSIKLARLGDVTAGRTARRASADRRDVVLVLRAGVIDARGGATSSQAVRTRTTTPLRWRRTIRSKPGARS